MKGIKARTGKYFLRMVQQGLRRFLMVKNQVSGADSFQRNSGDR